MTENELSKVVVDAAFKVHTKVGPGLLESVYEVILAHELQQRGLRVQRQVAIPIAYEGIRIEEAFRADIIINELLIVEVKSTESSPPVHKKQLLTYLRLTGLKLGLLINFGSPLIKDGIHRIVNGLEA